MPTFASIPSRLLRVTGWPHSGWHTAQDGDTPVKERLFRFDITDDGDGQFLLDYRSVDGVYFNDCSCENLEAAYATAERRFGIGRSEWTRRKS